MCFLGEQVCDSYQGIHHQRIHFAELQEKWHHKTPGSRNGFRRRYSLTHQWHNQILLNYMCEFESLTKLLHHFTGWLYGSLNGMLGYFPAEYVRPLARHEVERSGGMKAQLTEHTIQRMIRPPSRVSICSV